MLTGYVHLSHPYEEVRDESSSNLTRQGQTYSAVAQPIQSWDYQKSLMAKIWEHRRAEQQILIQLVDGGAV